MCWLENFKHHHGIRRGQYNGSAAGVFLDQCKAAGVRKVPTAFRERQMRLMQEDRDKEAEEAAAAAANSTAANQV